MSEVITKTPFLSLVVPFYNEEEVIDIFFPTVVAELSKLQLSGFEIVCVNDGSRDDTLPKLVFAASKDHRIRVVDLSRNFGKEAALSAGLKEARGDVLIPFDADLQDPPSVIAEMLRHFAEGYDVVLARRVDRSSDSFLKRKTASMFYWVHNRLSDVKIPENVGDFRLISREVADAIAALPENRRFMKGLFAWVGYRTITIDYTREPRAAGQTKFSGWKLWNFALEGLTSFSTVPLRIWTYLGGMLALFAILWAVMLLVRTLIFGIDVPGYASIAVAVFMLGGVQLIGIGVLGEYIGRIYMESKDRPVYIVRKRYENAPPSLS
ncbi:glycosyltransferase family 2 protein [Ciceribacter sp. L1K23]|uniref:glycosyltransferase family 2 protein n=1 Tax=Ciceribacter sp. L1K23 TaxID=2820276 RepID=UPI001B81AD84|nr:glycosyltransferase family 2 protein [Ciceribacter sp. L1K23]MBR0555826.1 glycosyltransferase family 2 protein [Ciceribacter sp. L1K23]